jgi:hypothetical protein
MMKLLVNIQKVSFPSGLNFFVFKSVLVKVRKEIIRMENTRATTPPNLLGMERRIAYANKKYHSG